MEGILCNTRYITNVDKEYNGIGEGIQSNARYITNVDKE